MSRPRLSEASPFLLAMITLGLCIRSFLCPGVVELAHCHRSAGDCVGQTVQLLHHARIVDLSSDGFVVEQLGAEAKVIGDSSGLVVGDSITLRGVWQADGTIRAEDWHVSQQRNWRVLVSIPVVLVSIWLFFRAFRWDGCQRAFVARHRA